MSKMLLLIQNKVRKKIQQDFGVIYKIILTISLLVVGTLSGIPESIFLRGPSLEQVLNL